MPDLTTREDTMIDTILVAVDGSEHSRRALEWACDMAPRYDARLHVLHVPQAVGHDKTLVLGGAAISVKTSNEDVEKAGHDVIEAARRIAADHAIREMTTEVGSGDPARRIVECAERLDADLIVMGRRGLTNFGGLLMGSVTHKVGHLAPCACMTVR
ncbi:universal stress protein [Salinisphaera orenii]|uniref:UspA domain-containing protein n=1 Tax=Salinisphaera orenii YIM 95161 TaxID=1051139 RepID=A0A423PSK2_9GAMM|nr:universal stress protein [Salinisphaera halophila]ROO28586.1 hypothetical protein SAHL_10090 [Salinisphaera halophila YIM 95161]